MLLRLLGALHSSDVAISTRGTAITTDVMAVVSTVAEEMLPSASVDTPLMEAGLDSLGAVEFRHRLATQLDGMLELPETLIFDFPTLRQLEAHLSATRDRAKRATISASGIEAGVVAQLTHSLRAVVEPPADAVKHDKASAGTKTKDLGDVLAELLATAARSGWTTQERQTVQSHASRTAKMALRARHQAHKLGFGTDMVAEVLMLSCWRTDSSAELQ